MKPRCTLPIAILVLAGWSFARAQSTTEFAIPDRLVIRAELLHGVNAEKAKPGDKVEMRALAAEKDGDRVLIEKDAKLTGRVIAATARSESSPESRLELVIERAEWKGHSVALNAFVIAQGQMRQSLQIIGITDRRCDPTFNRGRGPEASTPAYVDCARPDDASPAKSRGTPVLRDVEIRYLKGRSGPTMLVSQKTNVQLPSGLVVLIRNVKQ